MTTAQTEPHRKIPQYLLYILLFGFAHGLLYIFLIPLWEHYDEPGHYEYAWMIANGQNSLDRGEFNNIIRSKIHESLDETGFFSRRGWPAQTFSGEEPIWIGVTQVGDPPAYYIMTAILLRIFKDFPIFFGVYAGRLLSLIFFLLLIGVAWLIAGEWFPSVSNRWILPATVASLPPLVDLMTAFNNDALAITFFSFYIYIAILIIKKGPKLLLVATLIGLTIISFFIKASIWIAFVGTPLIMFFLPLRRRVWQVIALAGIALLVAVFTFRWDDAALWLRDTRQTQPTRVATSSLPSFAFQIVAPTPEEPASLLQAIPSSEIATLRGKEATLGAWMWSDTSCIAYPPSLKVIYQENKEEFIRSQPTALTLTPQFIAHQLIFPENVVRAFIDLSPMPDCTGVVYYARPVFTSGIYDLTLTPELNAAGTEGFWGQESFKNLARNPFALDTWPRFRPEFISLASSVDYRFVDGLNWYIYSLDIQGNLPLFTSSIRVLFETFWGRFSWGQVRLLGGKPFQLIGWITILGAFGAALNLAVNNRRFPVNSLVWVSIMVVISIAYAWFTSVSMGSLVSRPFFPVARFIFPVVIPLLSVWLAGCLYILTKITHNHPGSKIFFIVYFIILDIWAANSVWVFFKL